MSAPPPGRQASSTGGITSGITSSEPLCYTAVASALIHGGFLNLSKSCFRSVSSLTQTLSKQALSSPPRAIRTVRPSPQVLSVSRPVPPAGSRPLCFHQRRSISLAPPCDNNEEYFQKALMTCQVLHETNFNSFLHPSADLRCWTFSVFLTGSTSHPTLRP